MGFEPQRHEGHEGNYLDWVWGIYLVRSYLINCIDIFESWILNHEGTKDTKGLMVWGGVCRLSWVLAGLAVVFTINRTSFLASPNAKLKNAVWL